MLRVRRWFYRSLHGMLLLRHGAGCRVWARLYRMRLLSRMRLLNRPAYRLLLMWLLLDRGALERPVRWCWVRLLSGWLTRI
jgi:hypothetical protein